MATEFISNSWLMPTNANAEANRVSNYSLDFDGSSQYIDLGSTSDLDFQTSEMSISFWINSDTASGLKAILGNTNSSASSYQYLIDIHRTVGKISFLTSGPPILTSSLTINTNTWYHVCITKSGTTSNWVYTMYIDGSSLDGGTLSTTTNPPANQTTAIGRYGALSGYYFSGKLTEVSFFDYSLSSSQVTELYGTGSAIGNPMAITNGRKPINYYPLGNAAFNSEFLVPNGAEQDYVFDFLAAPTYSRISLGTSDFIGNKSISFWLNKNVNNGSVFAFGNTNYYPNVQSTTLQLNNGSTTILSTGTINLNEWNHYVITGDGTTAKCYVNGVYKSTGIDRDISSAANWIGGQNNGTGMLNGKLSNIQKWDVVLSDGGVSIGDVAGGDISTLYNYGTPYKGTQPQSANLQAWWELDASATFDGSNWSIPDASSNSNTGTSSGMTAANLVQSDLIINAPYDSFSLSFDGIGDRIDTPSIDLGLENTISFWAKRDGTNFNGIVFGGPAAANYYTVFPTSVNNINYRIGAGANVFTNADIVSTLGADEWFHCTLVRNNSGADVLCYINGDLKETLTGITGSGNNTIVQNIGARWNTNDFSITGFLSNISIYNSELSAAQVKTLYNEGKPFDLNTFAVTPVSWWRLGSVNSSYNSTSSEWTILDEIGTNNGTGSNLGPAQTALSDGIGATGSGLSSGMSSGTNRTGDAPYSDNNAVSYNMSVLAKSTSVPT